MASPAQVATDLSLWAVQFRGTGHDRLVSSLVRGQRTIHDLLKALENQNVVIRELEAAAEAEASQYERYVNGEVLS